MILRPLMAGAVMLALLLPGIAQAHPHDFIDVRVEVLFDQEGRMTGLREHWLFDELYSAVATDGFDMDGDGFPDLAALLSLAERNLKSLHDYGYFTKITKAGVALSLAKAENHSATMADGRMEMSFTLPLEKPEVVDDGLEYSIYDPSYYVEMLHRDMDAVIELVGAPAECNAELLKPVIDEALAIYAGSLGKNESGGSTLGEAFAEKVAITCKS